MERLKIIYGIGVISTFIAKQYNTSQNYFKSLSQKQLIKYDKFDKIDQMYPYYKDLFPNFFQGICFFIILPFEFNDMINARHDNLLKSD